MERLLFKVRKKKMRGKIKRFKKIYENFG